MEKKKEIKEVVPMIKQRCAFCHCIGGKVCDKAFNQSDLPCMSIKDRTLGRGDIGGEK